MVSRFDTADKMVLVLITLITAFGCTILYSAAGGSLYPWAIKQIIYFLLGLIIFLIIAHTDLRFWRNHSYTFYCISFILLIFVEFKGHIGMGGQRWINLYLFKLQPSELMKLSLVMALSQYFHTKTEYHIGKLITYIPPLILIALPSILVLRQPDLGTMIILAASGTVIIFMAGIRWWKITLAGIAILGSLPLLWSNMYEYQKKRVLNFINPEQDPLASGYHVIQSKIAIGSGSLWGKGYLYGTQSQLNFLPEKQTDFIFAMLCEEFGIMGGIFLIILYSILLAYALKISFECRNLYGRLLGLGLGWMLFLYVFINIGMVMGLLPAVGVPLPFISYGGTSMLTLLMGFGLLLSISVNQQTKFGRSY